MQRSWVKAIVALLVLIMMIFSGCKHEVELEPDQFEAIDKHVQHILGSTDRPGLIGELPKSLGEELADAMLRVQDRLVDGLGDEIEEALRELGRILEKVNLALMDKLAGIFDENRRAVLEALIKQNEAFRKFLLADLLPRLEDVGLTWIEKLMASFTQGAEGTLDNFFEKVIRELFPAALVIFVLFLLPTLFYSLIRAELIRSQGPRKPFREEISRTVEIATQVAIRWGVAASAMLVTLLISLGILAICSAAGGYPLRLNIKPAPAGSSPASPPARSPDVHDAGQDQEPGLANAGVSRRELWLREKKVLCPRLSKMTPSGESPLAELLRTAQASCEHEGPTLTWPSWRAAPDLFHHVLRSDELEAAIAADNREFSVSEFLAFQAGPYAKFDPFWADATLPGSVQEARFRKMCVANVTLVPHEFEPAKIECGRWHYNGAGSCWVPCR